jgi:hypothetical protein
MVVRVHGVDQPQENDLTLTISSGAGDHSSAAGGLWSAIVSILPQYRLVTFAKSLSPAPIGTRARLCRGGARRISTAAIAITGRGMESFLAWCMSEEKRRRPSDAAGTGGRSIRTCAVIGSRCPQPLPIALHGPSCAAPAAARSA